jgi:hypothetical protein
MIDRDVQVIDMFEECPEQRIIKIFCSVVRGYLNTVHMEFIDASVQFIQTFLVKVYTWLVGI